MTYKVVLDILSRACCQRAYKTVFKDYAEEIQWPPNLILQ